MYIAVDIPLSHSGDAGLMPLLSILINFSCKYNKSSITFLLYKLIMFSPLLPTGLHYILLEEELSWWDLPFHSSHAEIPGTTVPSHLHEWMCLVAPAAREKHTRIRHCSHERSLQGCIYPRGCFVPTIIMNKMNIIFTSNIWCTCLA